MTTERGVSPNGQAIVVRTQGSDRSLQAGPAYSIGRNPESDIVVDESRVSWRHAVLRLEGTTWLLEDVGSTNGIFIGAERVQRVEITADCVVRLGHPDDGQRLWCSVEAPPEPAHPKTTAAPVVPPPTSVNPQPAAPPPAPRLRRPLPRLARLRRLLPWPRPRPLREWARVTAEERHRARAPVTTGDGVRHPAEVTAEAGGPVMAEAAEA